MSLLDSQINHPSNTPFPTKLNHNPFSDASVSHVIDEQTWRERTEADWSYDRLTAGRQRPRADVTDWQVCHKHVAESFVGVWTQCVCDLGMLHVTTLTWVTALKFVCAWVWYICNCVCRSSWPQMPHLRHYVKKLVCLWVCTHLVSTSVLFDPITSEHLICRFVCILKVSQDPSENYTSSDSLSDVYENMS